MSNVLNIFTDASVDVDRPRNHYDGLSGCICVTKEQIIDSDMLYLPDSTNNLSEITAILLGVYKALQYRDMFDVINIFSDSKICIMGLREWIFKWRIHNGLFYGTGKDPIVNQLIFIEIINLITQFNLKINFYHQKGHIDTRKPESILTARSVFKDSNNLMMSPDFIKEISMYNDLIDNLTRKELSNPDKRVRRIVPFYFDINFLNLEYYSTLINRGGGFMHYE